MIGYKNTISGGSSIMPLIKIPENTKNVILLKNLIRIEINVYIYVEPNDMVSLRYSYT